MRNLDNKCETWTTNVKQGWKEEETGEGSRCSKQASSSHPSCKGGHFSIYQLFSPRHTSHLYFFYQCRLRLLKEERIKDYLLMEEEFISNQVENCNATMFQCCCLWTPVCCQPMNLYFDQLSIATFCHSRSCQWTENFAQERMKPQEEKNEEERTKVTFYYLVLAFPPIRIS